VSTKQAREKTVDELDLQNLIDDEAGRLLELANERVYNTDDMPEAVAGSLRRDRRKVVLGFRVSC